MRTFALKQWMSVLQSSDIFNITSLCSLINWPSVKLVKSRIDFTWRRWVSDQRNVREEWNLSSNFIMENSEQCNWLIRKRSAIKSSLRKWKFIVIESFSGNSILLKIEGSFDCKIPRLSSYFLQVVFISYRHETNNRICIILCPLKLFRHEEQTSTPESFLFPPTRKSRECVSFLQSRQNNFLSAFNIQISERWMKFFFSFALA